MRFQVQHHTAYAYELPVQLGSQRVRLRPRGDNVAVLEHWDLAVDPQPSGWLEALDVEGNRITCLWFEKPTERLSLSSRFTLHTESAAAGARSPETPGWDTATAPELRRRFQLPALADQGLFIGSESSFYRVLHQVGQCHRRGWARLPQEPRSVPRLRADVFGDD